MTDKPEPHPMARKPKPEPEPHGIPMGPKMCEEIAWVRVFSKRFRGDRMKRCSRLAKPGTPYCWQHQEKAK
jgi:hypothetical protein